MNIHTSSAGTSACNHGSHTVTSAHFSVPAAIHVGHVATHLPRTTKFFWFLAGYLSALAIVHFFRGVLVPLFHRFDEWDSKRMVRGKDCVRHITHPPVPPADKQDPPLQDPPF